MSYDLMVFAPETAPHNRADFLTWFEKQIKWSEDHRYDDPAVTTDALRAWFFDMIERFAPLNGPYATQDYDTLCVTDYSIGRSVIYLGFPWSQLQDAYDAVLECAQKHQVGFFDVSADDGEVWMPAAGGRYAPVHGSGRSSVALGEARIITLGILKPDQS